MVPAPWHHARSQSLIRTHALENSATPQPRQSSPQLDAEVTQAPSWKALQVQCRNRSAEAAKLLLRCSFAASPECTSPRTSCPRHKSLGRIAHRKMLPTFKACCCGHAWVAGMSMSKSGLSWFAIAFLLRCMLQSVVLCLCCARG